MPVKGISDRVRTPRSMRAKLGYTKKSQNGNEYPSDTDVFIAKREDGWSEEAEWTFGLSWLAIIYEKRGDKEKARQYLEQAQATVTSTGLPELYFSNSSDHNENTPLGWSESLFIVALHEVNARRMSKAA